MPGVNIGGWHDAGDFDLRVESQAGEAYILSLAYEAFHPEIDVTSIDYINRVTEIHQADGKNDLLQQVENGALSVVNSYLALGRLYRGIICGGLRQYVLLGDAAAMTDGKLGNEDDRWIFTEENPNRELSTAANLAAASRVLKGFNDTLSVHCLNIAREIFQRTEGDNSRIASSKIQAAVELYLATNEDLYKDFLLDNKELIVKQIGQTGWYTARVEQRFAQMKNVKAQAFLRTFVRLWWLTRNSWTRKSFPLLMAYPIVHTSGEQAGISKASVSVIIFWHQPIQISSIKSLSSMHLILC